MVQVGGYLTAEESEEFKRYAAEFHLKESSLANLLIARELRLRRLSELKQKFGHGPAGQRRCRITAHQADVGVKQAFEALAHEAGLCPDKAAGILFRAELSERWLAESVAYASRESV